MQRFLPFGYKLMLSYVVLITIPVVIIGYFSYSIFNQSIRDQTRINIQGTLQQIHDNISYKREDVERISDLLYWDATLVKHLQHYEEGWASYFATTEYLLPKFRSALETTSQQIWLSVYLHNESLPEIYNIYGTSDPLIREAQLFDIYHVHRIEDKVWYKNFPQEQYGVTRQWGQIENDVTSGRISLLRRIVDFPYPFGLKEIGFTRISLHMSELFEAVDHRKIGEDSVLVVMDDQNRIIYSSGNSNTVQNTEWTADGGNPEHSLIIRQPLKGFNLQLAASVTTDIIEKDAEKVRSLTAVVCVICFIVFSLIAIIISRYFTKRVRKIVSVLDSFREGDFHKRVNFRGKDEFYHIAQALNEMGRNTNQLIQEVYITTLRKKEAELESLQAQINPHFLYNTLSSISRLAKFGEVDKLHQMVMNLSAFYRLSLNEGRTLISIRKELEQAQSYLDIQKIKYEERMSVQFDIDPDIIRYDTIKLILQPFIENVLKHAWTADRIHIRITGELLGDCIVFRIIDDGIGIKPQRIREILDPHGTKNIGYGIRNVDQRIKLQHGNEYGVSIVSRPGIGTAVRIVIPAHVRKDSEERRREE